jgi:hypothetical protein
MRSSKGTELRRVCGLCSWDGGDALSIQQSGPHNAGDSEPKDLQLDTGSAVDALLGDDLSAHGLGQDT